MARKLKYTRYINYKICNITKIKNKYGFRIILTLDDNTKRTIQYSGFASKDIAEKERGKIIEKINNNFTSVLLEVH